MSTHPLRVGSHRLSRGALALAVVLGAGVLGCGPFGGQKGPAHSPSCACDLTVQNQHAHWSCLSTTCLLNVAYGCDATGNVHALGGCALDGGG